MSPSQVLRRIAVSTMVLALAPSAAAYEADVHYGLTQWLALRAGFTAAQAAAIALGNYRVDSGLIATMELSLEHACVGQFPEAASEVQARHYPSSKAVPAQPQQRAVVAGSAAARKELADLLPALADKEGLMLGKFGAALHPLQDSWSYAGAPGVPDPGAGVSCDPLYASTHPPSRGGPHPHAAALTHAHAADAVAMAAATYQALVAYPAIARAVRQPRPWASLVPLVEQFAKARSKTEKRDWFVREGVDETGFLRDTSLPDGPRPGPLEFPGRTLPPLKSATSNQYDAADDAKAFFDDLFARWLGSEPVDIVVKALATGSDARRRQLSARLKLWKLRDHGSAAVLAHARAPLSAAQLSAVDRLARAPQASVQPDDLRNAFFAVLPKSKDPPPLVPYVVRELPPGPQGHARSIALLRLRHAPYDTLGLVAERVAPGRWRLSDVVSVVDQ